VVEFLRLQLRVDEFEPGVTADELRLPRHLLTHQLDVIFLCPLQIGTGQHDRLHPKGQRNECSVLNQITAFFTPLGNGFTFKLLWRKSGAEEGFDEVEGRSERKAVKRAVLQTLFEVQFGDVQIRFAGI